MSWTVRLSMTDQELIELAYNEDLPHGDITTGSLENQVVEGYAFLVAKADVILSGQELFYQALRWKCPGLEVQWFFKDSEPILKGQKVAQFKGNLVLLLQAERVALNLLGYLSGIATAAHVFVQTIEEGSDLKILDTRKTLPLYRQHIKKAVRDGGAHNHRMNLSEAVLIKENHIRVAGGLKQAVEQVREKQPDFIELEVTNKQEVTEAVRLKVDRILLDNMDNETIKECLQVVPPEIETEASGNMTLTRVKELSKLEALNFISVGAITHSAPCADFSLLFEWPD